MPFTFDEITTTQIVGGSGWTDFGSSANNHLLNTVLLKLTLYIAEPSTFVYRLPNVLACFLYLIFAIRLGRILTPSKPYLTTLLLVSMAYLLDFFGLARGYGLSIAFLSGSLYYLLCCAKHFKSSRLFGALLFGICAVLSNYTLLHYFLPLLFVLLLLILKKKVGIFKVLVLFALVTSVFFILLMPVLLELKDGQHLIFGGRDSFYHSAILSLGRCFAYGVLNVKVAETIFAILFIIALLHSIIQLLKIAKNKEVTFLSILPIVFILMILSPISQNLLFDTFFPTERTALLYYPVLIILFIQSVDVYVSRFKHIILKAMSFGLIVHLVLTINLTHTYSWRYESGTNDIMECLQNQTVIKSDNVTLGTDYIYTPSVWFYQYHSNFINVETHEVIGCCWEFDMGIEELNPKYYGAGEYSKKEMSREDIDRIFKDNFDFYYLNGYTVRELSRNHISFRIIHKVKNADSYLIRF